MASFPDMDFSCPVCLEVYKDPVVLSCSHSFCKACLQNWWTEKVTRECPVCKRRSSKTDPPRNLVLKNLCETFSQQLTVGPLSGQSEALCPQHKEKLLLFCVDHQQPVCLVCRDSRAHHKHSFSPIEGVTQDYKEQLQQSLEPLKDRLKKCSDVRQNWGQTREHIKQQGQRTETLIRGEFDKMRAFLQKEEQARIRALRSEVQQKNSLMEQRVTALTQEMNTLSESIRQTEEELKAQDVPFLQNYSAAVRRVQQAPLKSVPQLPSKSLVDVAKHLGNLSFKIWNQMKDLVFYTPVVLDPNTAHPFLCVCDNLCSVYSAEITAMAEVPWFPDNPERFSEYNTVLGTEGYSSGTHCWEVEVDNNADWAVGVTEESVPRKGDIDWGYWGIWFRDGNYTAYSPSCLDVVLTLKQHLQKIKVNLDMDRQKVSFTDSQTGLHIHTFELASENKLFPFINTGNQRSIRILPVDLTVLTVS
ncbi:zinc-binding protein A33-like [Eucyclogobius newberryi]|uniref:zinc-binding protein A33-like n=1 Tax=Eucyclogobius newberryi TaxID=166745 RepID=UPI003B5928AA